MIENHKIKVTIMIPTYNQVVFIRDAIDSALAQTYPNLEVIVGDDASTDATPDIVAKIINPRLKYIRNKSNLGRVANYRNLLYNEASGDFVVNLDGDDYYTNPNFISEAVKLLDLNNQVVIVAAKVTIHTSKMTYISDIPNVASLTGLQILKKMPDKKYLFSHMAALYSRKLALSVDFYRYENLSSDWESLYRLSLRGMVRYIDLNVGVWRIHDANESRTTNIETLVKNLNIWETIFAEAVLFHMHPIVAKIYSARCVAAAAQFSCTNISLAGNKTLANFLSLVFRNYKLAFLFIAITPIYAARVAFSFFGFYRRKFANRSVC